MKLSGFTSLLNCIPKYLSSILIIGFFLNLAYSQDFLSEEKYDQEKNGGNFNRTGSRDYIPAFLQKGSLQEQGWLKYVRSAVQDGNLIETGLINQGQISQGYFSGGSVDLIWPKGSGTEYGHNFIFFAAAEVVDSHGDTIHIVSDRFNRGGAETAQDQSHKYHWMPLPKYFNNHHPNSIDWDIGGISEDVGLDGIPNTDDEGEENGKLEPQEDFNRNGRLDLEMLNEVEWFAVSQRRETWPAWWPPQSYEGDDRQLEEDRPGTAAGRWNGEYGYYVRADQESYYLMDDHENDEFDYFPFEDSLSMRPWPEGRRGLGVTVEVRNYQWAARLAEDIMISIYDITNFGKPLKKAIVGMVNDPDLGGSLSGDNASFDEIDDITYAWNEIGLSTAGLPTGYFGYAFLESPGLSFDGIDNDLDGLVDENQYNDIDEDGDWRPWQDLNGNGVWDTEDINYNNVLDNGEDLNANGIIDYEPMFDDVGSDGIGVEMEGYTGPDVNGTEANGIPDQGEPNFGKTDNDESDQVGLTSFYLRDVDQGPANDELFWSTEIRPGNFIVRPGYTRDIAWVYGSGLVELIPGKQGTQRYAISLVFGNDKDDIIRNKRTIQVIYDADYNFSKPPRKPLLTAEANNGQVLLMWDDNAERSKDPVYGRDFEAYMIYKSTNPNFSDIKTITDAFGNPIFFEPLAIFDLKDGLKGPHPIKTGSEIGPESDTGVAYNMGSDSGLRHSYLDTSVTNGRTYYYAVVSLDKGYVDGFYELGLADKPGLLPISPTECSAVIQTDQIGRVIYADRNTAEVIPTEPAAGWREPRLDGTGLKRISGAGTGKINIEIVGPKAIKTGNRYQIRFSDDGSLENLGPEYTGLTNGATLLNMSTKDILINLSGSITEIDNKLNDIIIDGFKINFINDPVIQTDTVATGWIKGASTLKATIKSEEARGTAVARDYEIRIMDFGADTSFNNKVTNFQIWDVTYPDSAFKTIFRFVANRNESDALKPLLSSGDAVYIRTNETNKRLWVLDFYFPIDLDSNSYILPENGDVFKLATQKPFDRHDVFEFTMVGNEINRSEAKDDMNNIYTVPNPYIAASSLERRVVSKDVGRGDRRIDFVNLPAECTVSIYTSSGRLVRKLQHATTENEGRESWDLRTKDGLEVTHGVYFYIVEAPTVGEKIGKLAIIK